MAVPSGTVTFLFTDVVGSTRLWDEHPQAMRQALEIHDRLVKDAIAAGTGYVFATGGDAFCAAFGSARDALTAAIAIQTALAGQVWPDQAAVRVRIGLYTGEAFERDGDYYGPAVNRAARLMGLGCGGEIICGEITARVLRSHLGDDVTLVDLGEQRLKGLAASEHAFGVATAGIEAPEAITTQGGATIGHVPRLRTRVVGRSVELDQIGASLARAWLVTLVGPGGVGTTYGKHGRERDSHRERHGASSQSLDCAAAPAEGARLRGGPCDTPHVARRFLAYSSAMASCKVPRRAPSKAVNARARQSIHRHTPGHVFTPVGGAPP